MTAIEMLHFYEELVKTHTGNKYFQYKPRTTRYLNVLDFFKKLKSILKQHNIDPEEFLRSQFFVKGRQPYPNTLYSKSAIDRYKRLGSKDSMQSYHNMQVEYLKSFLEIGYTKEEALSFDIFNYYFVYMYADYFPSKWIPKIKREMDIIPGLRQFLKGGKIDSTI